jgi:tetratricopeptide (TPR) repeat protein
VAPLAKLLLRLRASLAALQPRALRWRAADEGGEATVVEVLENAIAAHRARRWATAEPLFRRVIQSHAASTADRQVARNILGNLLERTGRIDAAIEAYEANVLEGFAGSYPYERLAAIYRKRQLANHELRVLRQAVAVVERQLASGHSDVVPQLERSRAALAKALQQHEPSTADRPGG